jgi:hypothetical protein
MSSRSGYWHARSGDHCVVPGGFLDAVNGRAQHGQRGRCRCGPGSAVLCRIWRRKSVTRPGPGTSDKPLTWAKPGAHSRGTMTVSILYAYGQVILGLPRAPS